MSTVNSKWNKDTLWELVELSTIDWDNQRGINTFGVDEYTCWELARMWDCFICEQEHKLGRELREKMEEDRDALWNFYNECCNSDLKARIEGEINYNE